MPVCFKTDIGPQSPFSIDYIVTTNPDGTVVKTQRTDFAKCEWVVLTGADYGNWQQLMSLSVDDAQTIGFEIGVVWAIAWGCKLVARVLTSNGSSEDA
jgi:hypothetical protein